MGVCSKMLWRRLCSELSDCLHQRPPRPVLMSPVEGGGVFTKDTCCMKSAAPSGAFIQLTLRKTRLNTHEGGSGVNPSPTRRNLAKLAGFPSRLAGTASATFLRGERGARRSVPSPPSQTDARARLFQSATLTGVSAHLAAAGLTFCLRPSQVAGHEGYQGNSAQGIIYALLYFSC